MDSHLHGGSPFSSAASSDNNHRHSSNNGNNSATQALNGNSDDRMQSWWESISKARSRIHLLASILPSAATGDEDLLSALADTDRPARSLLLSAAAYSSVSAALSDPTSGSADDVLCQWLYDTYLSSDLDLRRVVLSYVPLISAVYLHRIHHPPSDEPVLLAGFEAVLLALYSSETKARNGKPVTVTIPDLSQRSLYHSPLQPMKPSNSPHSKSGKPLVGILSPPLEPQVAVKSTKRACIVGVALDCYYKQISQMPNWSKIDFCRLAAVWAGRDCPCASELDAQTVNIRENNVEHENNKGLVNGSGVENGDVMDGMEGRLKDLAIGDDGSVEGEEEDARIPLPWELLQPVLRILGHCLLGPLSVDEVKDAASVSVRRLYARATHDLVPQAILATRSLIRLDRGARETAMAAASNTSSSNANTPSKAKKPEMLLVSK